MTGRAIRYLAALGAVLVAVLASLVMLDLAAAEEPSLGGARLQRLRFDDLAGWAADDHAAALQTFRRSCAAILAGTAALRSAQPPEPGLVAACDAAELDDTGARAFFERRFEPWLVQTPSGQGFLTGYFEPEYAGALAPHPDYPTPLFARPDDLVSAGPGETLPGLDPALQAGRRQGEGFAPYPDRAAIEDGGLGERARPVAFVRDPVAAFVIHVQGSARLRLPDGGIARLAYAGRNGWPYTSIGRILVEEGRLSREAADLEGLTAWLRANPEEGRAVMRRNRSYIFFRLASELDPGEGPIGGAGVPLTPGRSLAVDRTLWSYGMPVWLEGELPRADGGVEPLARLMVAQDTGSAILGPARGDFFFGSGEAPGRRAGLTRHPVRFIVLRPRAAAQP